MSVRGSFKVLAALGLVFTGASCASVPMGGPAPGPATNAIFVPANTADPNAQLAVTERVADVLAYYNFEIDPSQQVEGTITTRYKTGSNILELWHKDSVGPANRCESTLQPIRRKVLIHLVKTDGGFLVTVEALKELEDMASQSPNSAGTSTFIEDYPLRRDLNLVVGQSTPSGWIPLGHDVALEQDMVLRMQSALSSR